MSTAIAKAVMAEGAQQLELAIAHPPDPPPTWGGARKGAGRPKLPRRTTEPHRRRLPLSPRHPVHVVQRTVPLIGRLRRRRAYHAIRHAIIRVLRRHDFRVVHVSIQHSHLHFLVEADDERALARGMQSLLISAARALNAAAGRARGTVFPQRYHCTHITTPRQARNELAYVLNNWRRHREDLATAATRRAHLDPYSSAVAFPGWAEITRPFAWPRGYQPLPVSYPTVWLLTTGWRRWGPVALRSVPGGRHASR